MSNAERHESDPDAKLIAMAEAEWSRQGREMIRHSVEINRRPEDVFAYLGQLDRYVEWQESLISTRVDTEGPTRVGSRGVDTRKAPGGPRDIPFEVTDHDPPRKITFRGTAGPVRPVATLTVEPVGDGSGSRVSLELDLQGHGFGSSSLRSRVGRPPGRFRRITSGSRNDSKQAANRVRVCSPS